MDDLRDLMDGLVADDLAKQEEWNRKRQEDIITLGHEVGRLQAENERLRETLAHRDKFIVEQGLWLEFVDSLPPLSRAALKEPDNA